MFKCTVSQCSSPSLPGSNTGIQYKSCVSVIKCRLIAFTLLFLKAFKAIRTAGRNLSALHRQAQWRQQKTVDVFAAVDHRPLWWIHFRLCKMGSAGRRHSIKGQQCASPVDYSALIWHRQMTDLEPCWWMRDWPCVKEWGRGSVRQKERERKRNGEWASEWAGAAVPTKSILLNFSCGQSSLSSIVLLGDRLQNFNKSSPAKDTWKHSLSTAPLWFQNEEF